ncbi:NAD(P)-dependent oxidoreductase [Luteipulveratus halotolerans]|uniref:6-phosphogluconate dehydrogenase n=1 Tax=Luteipulveratus halotolerans TaxID=1631356 RepID=A0A0L6CL17_9MICO|nr:NAD(P)-binding domain-containing protein [Luteipulveratus halotolerans]KNX38340.1 6-phosphogluconate dehydrogenase [Luteipulveratus halotolerans]
MSPALPSTTLIGLGPMGRAMGRVLLEHDVPLTVFNRTPARGDALVAAGARRTTTVAEALDASDLVVLSLTDYAAMYDLLGDVTDHLAGKTLVNLSSDNPQETECAAVWAAEHGVRLLVGGVMVPEPLVGSEVAYAFYSGPRAALEEYDDVLRLIAAPRYVGEAHGLAQLHYQAQLDIFLTCLAGVLHGYQLVASAGVRAADFTAYVKDNVDSLSMYLEETARHLDADDHPGDAANLRMMGATADHVVRASEQAGLDATLPRAVQALYARGIAAGHGDQSWTALARVISGRRSVER